MNKRFLSNVYEGNNALWRYFVVIGSVVIFWGTCAYFLVIGADDLLTSLAIDQLVSRLVSGALPFLCVIIWLAAMVKLLHGRSFHSLINAEAGVHYGRIVQGFCLWIVLMMGWTGLDIWLSPQHYHWAFDPGRWFWLLPVSALLVPIKTSAEELLFRGYVMQGLRLMTKRPLLLLLMNGVVFALPHLGNPEMLRGSFILGALHYFVWGVIFAAITLMDNGLELALGVHTAHNMFSYLMVGTLDSVVVTPTLWVQQVPVGPLASICVLLINGAIFYSVFFSRLPRQMSVSS